MARAPLATMVALRDQTGQAGQREIAPPISTRWQRSWLFVAAFFSAVTLVILAAPSVVSHSQYGRTLVSRAIAKRGVDFDFEFLRIGWSRPLRLSGVRIRCRSTADRFRVHQIDSDMTFGDLLGWSNHSMGHWVLRGIEIHSAVHEDRFSIEDDFKALPMRDHADDSVPSGSIEFQDVALRVTDPDTGKAWEASRVRAQFQLQPDNWVSTFSGRFTEDGKSGGQLAGKFSAPTTPDDKQSRFEFQAKSFPLSVLTVLQRRFLNGASTIPSLVAGDASGALCIASDRDGVLEIDMDDFNVENLEVTDSVEHASVWSNRRALLDGKFVVSRDQVVGELVGESDLASFRLDGVIPRPHGVLDAVRDPVTWLRAMDGTASVEIDLVAIQKLLAGVLPLRDQAQIVSGTCTANIETVNVGADQHREIKIKTSALQVEVDDRVVDIDPIDVEATVSSSATDELKVKRFHWNSSFADVAAKGSYRDGTLDVEVDLKQLNTLLSLFRAPSRGVPAGTIKGNLQWSEKQDHSWCLTGSAAASNVQALLNGTRQVRLPQVTGKIDVSGCWGDQTLEELSEATVTLVGSDLSFLGKLTKPVRNIAPDSPLPMRVEATGSLRSLASFLRPWMPEDTYLVDGRLDAKMEGEFSIVSGRLTQATLELSQPRIAYRHRLFHRRELKVDFDGQWQWLQGEFNANLLTVTGDGISAEIRGRAGLARTDLEIVCARIWMRCQTAKQTASPAIHSTAREVSLFDLSPFSRARS